MVASGDPLCHGIGTMLLRTFSAEGVRFYPAPSSFSLAVNRLGWSMQHVHCLSAHGRDTVDVMLRAAPGARILVLTSDGAQPLQIAKQLARIGFGEAHLHVLETLGAADERIVSTNANEMAHRIEPFAALNLLAIDCTPVTDAQALPAVPGLPMDVWDHDGQVTKPEVRAATLAALAPMPRGVLWDVGAGCGSVAVEWVRASLAMLPPDRTRAYAIEPRADRQFCQAI
ncbi:MAG: precorrin-6y C5,15-methyltransferase (decarboxylating) subunit CbiE, partial [Pseudomonadota bacterium]